MVALAAVIALSVAPAVAVAKLLSPKGPWPAPVAGATNPLNGTQFVANGGHASANVSLRVWLPAGKRRRTQLTRTIGESTIVRGRLHDRVTRHSISGALLLVVAQNAGPGGGDWYLAGAARTNRKGQFKATLPPGGTRRAAVLYWPFAGSTEPIYSRRLLIRAAARVYVKVTARGRSVLYRGRVSGAPIPPNGLVVAAQVRNGGSWVSVKLPRTDATGRFAARYRFRSRGQRFFVRAFVPAQAGWPLYSGASQVHRIRT